MHRQVKVSQVMSVMRNDCTALASDMPGASYILHFNLAPCSGGMRWRRGLQYMHCTPLTYPGHRPSRPGSACWRPWLLSRQVCSPLPHSLVQAPLQSCRCLAVLACHGQVPGRASCPCVGRSMPPLPFFMPTRGYLAHTRLGCLRQGRRRAGATVRWVQA